MRINRLDLIAFGPFTDATLDFASDEHDFHLVYGPNEAGKSSALRAISSWLFRIDPRSTDNFVHDYKNMRVGGEVRNSDGATLSFVRRKGNKNDILEPESNKALPASTLDPFVGGLDSETFERIWGIDHRRLIEGGAELRALKGLAGESLFAASMGVRNLSHVLAALDQEGQQIFLSDRRSATEIRKLKKRFDEAGKTRRDAEVSVTQWNKLRKDLKSTMAREAEVGKELLQRTAESKRLARIRTILEEVGEFNALRAELADMQSVPLLPPDYTTEARLETQHALATITSQLDQTTRELDGSQGLIARREAIAVDDSVVDEEAAIEQLLKKAGAYQKACTDLPKRQGERRVLVDQAQRLLADIDATLDWEGAESRRVSKTLEAEVTRLGRQEGGLVQNLDGKHQQIIELEREVEQTRDALDAIAAPIDVSSLKRAVKQASKQGDLPKLAAEKATQAKREADKAGRAISRLGHWSGAVEEVATVRLPLRSTVEKYGERFRHLDNEKTQIEQTAAAHRQELAELEREIHQLQRERQVPLRSELAEHRQRREQGWQLIRRVWLDGDSASEDVAEFAGESKLEQAYEESVQRADHTADRLIDESELSAKLEHKREQCEKLRVLVGEQQALREKWEPVRETLQTQWEVLWTEQGITEPLSPAEMAEWLDAFGALRDTVRQLEAFQQEAQKYEQAASENVALLTTCLSDLGHACEASEPRFDDLMARCEEVIEDEARRDRDRVRLTEALAEKQKKLEAQRDAEQKASKELDDWKIAWAAAVRELGCGEECSVERATAHLQLVRDYFAVRQAIKDLDAKRIEPMLEDKRNFEEDVSRVVERCAPELSEMDAATAADTLAKRLKTAVQANQARKNLDEQVADKRQQRERLSAEKQVAEKRLEQLCALAGVGDPQALVEVETSARRKSEVMARLEEVERRVLREGQGKTVDELIAEVEGKSRDQIDAELIELEQQIKALDKERVDLAISIDKNLRSQCDAVDGSANAAAADQVALGCAAHAAELAERYATLRLAANLLRRRIERHRSENQDPMIARSSEMFSRLTCGSFAGLTLDYDEKEQPTIVGVRQGDDTRLPVDAFSRGTADQLYLALRLAYLEARLADGEPMPIILDDLLVDFDDMRAAAALEVLSDLSKRTQIILFTHHQHLRELAREKLGDDKIREHLLNAVAFEA